MKKKLSSATCTIDLPIKYFAQTMYECTCTFNKVTVLLHTAGNTGKGGGYFDERYRKS